MREHEPAAEEDHARGDRQDRGCVHCFLLLLYKAYAGSPCCERSSPRTSSSSWTRSGTKRLTNLRIAKVPIADHAQEAPTATNWTSTCFGLPKNSPLAAPALMATVANNPVAIAPQVPPMPWTAQTSSASSTWIRSRSWIAA